MPSPSLPNDVIAATLQGDHPDPFAYFGMHRTGSVLVVRAFLPGAKRVEVVERATGRVVAGLDLIEPAGLFAGRIPGRADPFPYRLRIERGGSVADFEDPYRFGQVMGQLDVHLLGEGSHLRSFEKLGAHVVTFDGVTGTAFALWAPNAMRASVVGDFNRWDGRVHPMRRRDAFWELFIPGVEPGARYKFELKAADGSMLPLKADPYAFRGELRPANASIVTAPVTYSWNDGEWLANRVTTSLRDRPISIYEVHLGSWRRDPDDPDRFLTYLELADALVPYVKDMGFTHVELLPISEYPFDGSWGYQPTGMFAPTARHGTPDEFRTFIERFHEAGIGVLIDWVPGHFPTDAHGLGYFDGTHLYEHADSRQGFHPDWNTLIYNYGRNEVANFLFSNALYWLERFHVDGLRVDAVASMLYLDYSREAGEWIPNQFGGRENLEAIQFIRRMNELAYGGHDGVMTIAEESTAWPQVSGPTYAGGLGFGYKWNMGWMHDTLSYMSKDPLYRRYHQNELTFSLVYAFSENYILPLSHDEVVHGKGSIYSRIPGDVWQKFANVRLLYGYMFTHPGKKLLFMGNEFAQEYEWKHDHSLDWHHVSDNPSHRGVQDLVRDLNAFYRGRPALYERDCEPEGFEWIDFNDAHNSVIAYVRRGRDPESYVLVVCNFTPAVRPHYRIGVPAPGRYREVLNTDAAAYGGSGVANGEIHAEQIESHGRPWSIALTLPPLAAVVFENVDRAEGAH